MEERNNEDTDQGIINIVKNDLREEITIHDIDRTHRLGKRKLYNTGDYKRSGDFALFYH